PRDGQSGCGRRKAAARDVGWGCAGRCCEAVEDVATRRRRPAAADLQDTSLAPIQSQIWSHGGAAAALVASEGRPTPLSDERAACIFGVGGGERSSMSCPCLPRSVQRDRSWRLSVQLLYF